MIAQSKKKTQEKHMAFIQKAHLNRLHVWAVFLWTRQMSGRPLIRDYDCAKNDHGSKSLERIITIVIAANWSFNVDSSFWLLGYQCLIINYPLSLRLIERNIALGDHLWSKIITIFNKQFNHLHSSSIHDGWFWWTVTYTVIRFQILCVTK